MHGREEHIFFHIRQLYGSLGTSEERHRELAVHELPGALHSQRTVLAPDQVQHVHVLVLVLATVD
jgi:hypothetical protein